MSEKPIIRCIDEMRRFTVLLDESAEQVKQAAEQVRQTTELLDEKNAEVKQLFNLVVLAKGYAEGLEGRGLRHRRGSTEIRV